MYKEAEAISMEDVHRRKVFDRSLGKLRGSCSKSKYVIKQHDNKSNVENAILEDERSISMNTNPYEDMDCGSMKYRNLK